MVLQFYRSSNFIYKTHINVFFWNIRILGYEITLINIVISLNKLLSFLFTLCQILEIASTVSESLEVILVSFLKLKKLHDYEITIANIKLQKYYKTLLYTIIKHSIPLL